VSVCVGELGTAGRRRAYHAALGTWASRDPAGYADGPNLTEYVGGAAVSRIDPMGLAATQPTTRPQPMTRPADRARQPRTSLPDATGAWKYLDEADADSARIWIQLSGHDLGMVLPGFRPRVIFKVTAGVTLKHLLEIDFSTYGYVIIDGQRVDYPPGMSGGATLVHEVRQQGWVCSGSGSIYLVEKNYQHEQSQVSPLNRRTGITQTYAYEWRYRQGTFTYNVKQTDDSLKRSDRQQADLLQNVYNGRAMPDKGEDE